MFAGGTILDRALAAVMLCRSFFSRYHPCASGSFGHFIIPLQLNFYPKTITQSNDNHLGLRLVALSREFVSTQAFTPSPG